MFMFFQVELKTLQLLVRVNVDSQDTSVSVTGMCLWRQRDPGVPDLGKRGALDDAAELDIFSSNQGGVPQLVLEARRH